MLGIIPLRGFPSLASLDRWNLVVLSYDPLPSEGGPKKELEIKKITDMVTVVVVLDRPTYIGMLFVEAGNTIDSSTTSDDT